MLVSNTIFSKMKKLWGNYFKQKKNKRLSASFLKQLKKISAISKNLKHKKKQPGKPDCCSNLKDNVNNILWKLIN